MEIGCVESLNRRFRDELLACEVFNTLAEARVLIEQRRMRYNTVRSHSALGSRSPAPEVVLTAPPMLPSTPEPVPPRPTMQ